MVHCYASLLQRTRREDETVPFWTYRKQQNSVSIELTLALQVIPKEGKKLYKGLNFVGIENSVGVTICEIDP